tara:strand:+ start:1422 stop:2237 length:816 start_codon:yes stop_codon:yes gene_type:complete
MSLLNIGEYMREVNSRTRPLRNSEKQRIKQAFPNMKNMTMPGKGFGTMFNFGDFANMLQILSRGELEHMFLEAGADAGRMGITLVKQKFRAKDSNYSKKAQTNGLHSSITSRLKRQSSGRSIYRYVADNLNYKLDGQKGIISGFVGEDLNDVLKGSRGQPLAPLVEGLPAKVAKAPVNMSIHPSISYRPKSRNGRLPHMIRVKPRRRLGSGKGRKPRRLKFPGNKPDMVPVLPPDPVPFINFWATKTVGLIFDRFMQMSQQRLANNMGRSV